MIVIGLEIVKKFFTYNSNNPLDSDTDDEDELSDGEEFHNFSMDPLNSVKIGITRRGVCYDFPNAKEDS